MNKICFGSAKRFWVMTNKPYVLFFAAEDVSIFSYEAVQLHIKRAVFFVYQLFVKNRYAKILFVNTLARGPADMDSGSVKRLKQGSPLTRRFERENYKMPFIINWVPGMLTNYYSTIFYYQKYIYKRKIKYVTKNRRLMLINARGLNKLTRFPSAVVFFSTYGRYAAGVKEATRLGIPSIGLMDTNSNFSTLDYFIPSNDSTYKGVFYFFKLFIDAVLRGLRNNLLHDEGWLPGNDTGPDGFQRLKMMIGRQQRGKSVGSRLRRTLRKARRIMRHSRLLKFGKVVTKLKIVRQMVKFFSVKVKSVLSLPVVRYVFKRKHKWVPWWLQRRHHRGRYKFFKGKGKGWPGQRSGRGYRAPVHPHGRAIRRPKRYAGRWKRRTRYKRGQRYKRMSKPGSGANKPVFDYRGYRYKHHRPRRHYNESYNMRTGKEFGHDTRSTESYQKQSKRRWGPVFRNQGEHTATDTNQQYQEYRRRSGVGNVAGYQVTHRDLGKKSDEGRPYSVVYDQERHQLRLIPRPGATDIIGRLNEELRSREARKNTTGTVNVNVNHGGRLVDQAVTGQHSSSSPRQSNSMGDPLPNVEAETKVPSWVLWLKKRREQASQTANTERAPINSGTEWRSGQHQETNKNSIIENRGHSQRSTRERWTKLPYSRSHSDRHVQVSADPTVINKQGVSARKSVDSKHNNAPSGITGPINDASSGPATLRGSLKTVQGTEAGTNHFNRSRDAREQNRRWWQKRYSTYSPYRHRQGEFYDPALGHAKKPKQSNENVVGKRTNTKEDSAYAMRTSPKNNKHTAWPSRYNKSGTASSYTAKRWNTNRMGTLQPNQQQRTHRQLKKSPRTNRRCKRKKVVRTISKVGEYIRRHAEAINTGKFFERQVVIRSRLGGRLKQRKINVRGRRLLKNVGTLVTNAMQQYEDSNPTAEGVKEEKDHEEAMIGKSVFSVQRLKAVYRRRQQRRKKRYGGGRVHHLKRQRQRARRAKVQAAKGRAPVLPRTKRMQSASAVVQVPSKPPTSGPLKNLKNDVEPRLKEELSRTATTAKKSMAEKVGLTSDLQAKDKTTKKKNNGAKNKKKNGTKVSKVKKSVKSKAKAKSKKTKQKEAMGKKTKRTKRQCADSKRPKRAKGGAVDAVLSRKTSKGLLKQTKVGSKAKATTNSKYKQTRIGRQLRSWLRTGKRWAARLTKEALQLVENSKRRRIPLWGQRSWALVSDRKAERLERGLRHGVRRLSRRYQRAKPWQAVRLRRTHWYVKLKGLKVYGPAEFLNRKKARTGGFKALYKHAWYTRWTRRRYVWRYARRIKKWFYGRRKWRRFSNKWSRWWYINFDNIGNTKLPRRVFDQFRVRKHLNIASHPASFATKVVRNIFYSFYYLSLAKKLAYNGHVRG